MPLINPTKFDNFYSNIRDLTSLLEDPKIREEAELIKIIIDGIQRNIDLIKETQENGKI